MRITVAAGFPTTVTPLIQYGAVPVFVDVTIPQYNIDVTMLEEAYSEKTKAVMIAHTLGNPFDLAAVKHFCDRHNLWLVEDNCDALEPDTPLTGGAAVRHHRGYRYLQLLPASPYDDGRGRRCLYEQPDAEQDHPVLPRLGAGTASAHREGTTCAVTASTRQFGELPLGYDHKYVYSHFGYNLKATDMQATIGCAQLKKFPTFVERRRHNFDRLRAAAVVEDH